MKRLVKSTLPRSLPMGGMMMSSTREVTIFPNAAPMMTPTARSITFPLAMNSRNSFNMTHPPFASSRNDERPMSDGKFVDGEAMMRATAQIVPHGGDFPKVPGGGKNCLRCFDWFGSLVDAGLAGLLR